VPCGCSRCGARWGLPSSTASPPVDWEACSCLVDLGLIPLVDSGGDVFLPPPASPLPQSRSAMIPRARAAYPSGRQWARQRRHGGHGHHGQSWPPLKARAAFDLISWMTSRSVDQVLPRAAGGRPLWSAVRPTRGHTGCSLDVWSPLPSLFPVFAFWLVIIWSSMNKLLDRWIWMCVFWMDYACKLAWLAAAPHQMDWCQASVQLYHPRILVCCNFIHQGVRYINGHYCDFC
jgi:hypothetical protein